MDSVLNVLIPCCLGAVTIVQAAPVVIHDAGNTTPITTYRSVLQGDTPITRATLPDTETATPTRKRGIQTSRTHLSSSALGTSGVSSSAHITPNVEHPNAVQPVFVIDGTASSLDWLICHREALITMQATGAVVGTVSAHQYQTLTNAARGLTLIPSELNRVASTYGITRYPVLITAPGATP